MTASAWSPNPATVTQANANGLLKMESFVAVAAQHVFNLTTFAYTVGTGSLVVFQNGKILSRNVDYLEVGNAGAASSSFILAAGASGNDNVTALGFVGISGSAAVDAQLRSDIAAAGGSALMGHLANVTYGAVRTIKDKINGLGVYAEDFAGYDGTGVADSTTAIQSAVNIANLLGTNTVYISGKPRLTAPLTYTSSLSFIGTSGKELFTNLFTEAPVKINCSAVNGYLFDMPDGAAGSGALAIANICFDGKDGNGNNSLTWSGLVKASTTPGKSTFWLRTRNVLVGNSDATTPILALTGSVFTKLEDTYFSNWRKGIGIQAVAGNYVGTTLSLTKCYFNSLRQAYEIYDSFTDVTFNQCVIESCTVAGASMKANITFNQLYSENMGYDPTGSGVTTGLSVRNMGINDATAIAGNVSSVFTARYGQLIFNSPTIQASTGGKKWFEGIGRGSAVGYGGKIELNNPHFAAGTLNTLWAVDDATSSVSAFEYHMYQQVAGAFLTHADARRITKGRVGIAWSDGNVRPVEIESGVFTTPRLLTGGFSYYTNLYPSGGQNQVGDKLMVAPSALAAGATDCWICTTAGTPGKWDTNSFMPLAISGTLNASGGTFSVPVVYAEPGFIYIYEVMASAFGVATSWSGTIKVAQYNSGASLSVDVSTGLAGDVTAAVSYNNPITLTNTTANAMNILVRLTSVGRTHA